MGYAANTISHPKIYFGGIWPQLSKKQGAKLYLDWAFPNGVHEVKGRWTKMSGEKFVKENSLIFENNSVGTLVWLWILLAGLLVFTFPFLLPFSPIFLGISLCPTRRNQAGKGPWQSLLLLQLLFPRLSMLTDCTSPCFRDRRRPWSSLFPFKSEQVIRNALLIGLISLPPPCLWVIYDSHKYTCWIVPTNNPSLHVISEHFTTRLPCVTFELCYLV